MKKTKFMFLISFLTVLLLIGFSMGQSENEPICCYPDDENCIGISCYDEEDNDTTITYPSADGPMFDAYRTMVGGTFNGQHIPNSYTNCIVDSYGENCTYESIPRFFYEEGVVQEINYTIDANQTFNCTYEFCIRTVYDADFSNSSSDTVMFKKNGYNITFKPRKLQYVDPDGSGKDTAFDIVDVPGTVEGDKFIYYDAYGTGIDLVYTPWTLGIKEELIIDSFTRLPEPDWVEVGNNPNFEFELIVKATGEFSQGDDNITVLWNKQDDWMVGHHDVNIYDRDNNTVFYLPAPFVYDSGGNRTQANYTFKAAGENLFVYVSVPYSWLENAVYPVYIDPSVTLDGADYLQDAYIRSDSPSINFDGGFLRIITSSSESDHWNALMEFDVSQFSTATVINSANLSMYIVGGGADLDAGESIDINAHTVYDSYSWAEGTVDWDVKPTAVTDYDTTAVDSVNFDGSSTASTYYYWDVTNSLQFAVTNSYTELTLYMIPSYVSGSPAISTADSVDFCDKENCAGSQIPYISVNYINVYNVDEDTIANDLAMYWKFDGNNLLDVSGNSNHGRWYVDDFNDPLITPTDNGSNPLYTTTSKLGAGAFSFDGEKDYISAGPISTEYNSSITMSAWVYSENFDDNMGVITKEEINDNWQIFHNNGGAYGTIYCRGGGTTSRTYVFLSSQNSAWHHFACVIEGDQSTLYWDGVAVSGPGSANPIVKQLDDIRHGILIGSRYKDGTDTYTMNGSIDEVAIWTRALNSTELQGIYYKEWQFNCNNNTCATGSACNQVTGVCESPPNIIDSGYSSDIWYDDFESYEYKIIDDASDSSIYTISTDSVNKNDVVTKNGPEGEGYVSFDVDPTNDVKDYAFIRLSNFGHLPDGMYLEGKYDRISYWLYFNETSGINCSYDAGTTLRPIHSLIYTNTSSNIHSQYSHTCEELGIDGTETDLWVRVVVDLSNPYDTANGGFQGDQINRIGIYTHNDGATYFSMAIDHLYAWQSWNWPTATRDWDSLILDDFETPLADTHWFTYGQRDFGDGETRSSIFDMTSEFDTEEYVKQGTQAMEIFSNISLHESNYGYITNYAYNIDKPWDLSNYDKVAFWFYINDSNHLEQGSNSSLVLYLYYDQPSDDEFIYYTPTEDLQDGWNYIEHDLRSPDVIGGLGSINDLNHIDMLRFTVSNDNNTAYPTAIMRFDDLKAYKQSRSDAYTPYEYQRWDSNAAYEDRWEIQIINGRQQITMFNPIASWYWIRPHQNGYINDDFEVIGKMMMDVDLGGEYNGFSTTGTTRNMMANRLGAGTGQIRYYSPHTDGSAFYFGNAYDMSWGRNEETERLYKAVHKGNRDWWYISHNEGKTWRLMTEQIEEPENPGETFYHSDDVIYYCRDSRCYLDYMIVKNIKPLNALETGETVFDLSKDNQYGYIVNDNINEIENISVDWHNVLLYDDFEKYSYKALYSFEDVTKLTAANAATGLVAYTGHGGFVDGTRGIYFSKDGSQEYARILFEPEPETVDITKYESMGIPVWLSNASDIERIIIYVGNGTIATGSRCYIQIHNDTGVYDKPYLYEWNTGWNYVRWDIDDMSTGCDPTQINDFEIRVYTNNVASTLDVYLDHLYLVDNSYYPNPYYISHMDSLTEGWLPSAAADADILETTESSTYYVEGKASYKVYYNISKYELPWGFIIKSFNPELDLTQYDRLVYWTYIDNISLWERNYTNPYTNESYSLFGLVTLFSGYSTNNSKWILSNSTDTEHYNYTYMSGRNGWHRIEIDLNTPQVVTGTFNKSKIDRVRIYTYNSNISDGWIRYDNFYAYNSKDDRPIWIERNNNHLPGVWDIQTDTQRDEDIHAQLITEQSSNQVLKQSVDDAVAKTLWLDNYEFYNEINEIPYIFTARVRSGTGWCGLTTSKVVTNTNRIGVLYSLPVVQLEPGNGTNYRDDWDYANSGWVWLRLIMNGTHVIGYYSKDGNEWIQHSAVFTIDKWALEGLGLFSTSGSCWFDDVTITELDVNDTSLVYYPKPYSVVEKKNVEQGDMFIGDVTICNNNSVCSYDRTPVVDSFDYTKGEYGFYSCYDLSNAQKECYAGMLTNTDNADPSSNDYWAKPGTRERIRFTDFLSVDEVTIDVHGRDGGPMNPTVYLSEWSAFDTGGLEKYEVWSYDGNYISDDTITFSGENVKSLDYQYIYTTADSWSSLIFDNVNITGFTSMDARTTDPVLAPVTFSDTANDYYYYLMFNFENTDSKYTTNDFIGPNITNQSVHGDYANNWTYDASASVNDYGVYKVEHLPKDLVNYDRVMYWLYISDISVVNCSFTAQATNENVPIVTQLISNFPQSSNHLVNYGTTCDGLKSGWNRIIVNLNEPYNQVDVNYTKIFNQTRIYVFMNTSAGAPTTADFRIDHMYAYRSDKYFDDNTGNYTEYEDIYFGDTDGIWNWAPYPSTGDATSVSTHTNITYVKELDLRREGMRAINLTWTATEDATRNWSSWTYQYWEDNGLSIDISKYDTVSWWIYIPDVNQLGCGATYEGVELDLYSDWSTSAHSTHRWNCSELQNGWNYLEVNLYDGYLSGSGGSGGPLDPTVLEVIRPYVYNNATDGWVLIDGIRVFHSEHYYNQTLWADGYPTGNRGDWSLAIVENEYGEDTQVLQHVKDYGSSPATMRYLPPGETQTAYTKSHEFITRVRFGREVSGYATRCGISAYGTTRQIMLLRDTGIYIAPEEGTNLPVWKYILNTTEGDVRWLRYVVDNGQLTFYYKNATHQDWVEVYTKTDGRLHSRSPAILTDEGNCYYDNMLFREIEQPNTPTVVDEFFRTTGFANGPNYYSGSTIDSFEDETLWILGSDDGVLKILSSDNIEKDTSMQVTQDITNDAGSQQARVTQEFTTNRSLEFFDSIGFWYYTDNAANNKFGVNMLQVAFYTNTTDVGNHYARFYVNDSFITLNDGWNYIKLSLDDFQIIGNYNNSHIEKMRIWSYNDNTTDIINRYDNMYAYNSSHWISQYWDETFNQDGLGAVDIAIWNASDYSTGTTDILNIYDPADGGNTTAVAWNDWNYDSFEVVVKAITAQDLGSDTCIVSFRVEGGLSPRGRNGLWWYGTTIRVLDDEGDNIDTVVSQTKYKYIYVKAKYNDTNKWMEWYYANDTQQTWQLLSNYTVDNILGSVNRLQLGAKDAQCLFDNLVIKDITPYDYSVDDNNFSTSYLHGTIYDVVYDRDRSNVTYEWYKDSDVNATYTDIVYDPTDFSQTTNHELSLGNWYFDTTVCYYNTGINCSTRTSEVITLGEPYVRSLDIKNPILTSDMFIDDFNDYDYSYIFGFNDLTESTGVGSSTPVVITTNNNTIIEGDGAIEIDLIAGAGDYDTINLTTPVNCEGDTISYWFRHSNITLGNPTSSGRLGLVYIGQDVSNYFINMNVYNSTLINAGVGSNEWIRVDFPKSSLSDTGSPTWTNISWIRYNVQGVTGSNVTAQFDHLYCYNSSNWFTTSGNWIEEQSFFDLQEISGDLKLIGPGTITDTQQLQLNRTLTNDYIFETTRTATNGGSIAGLVFDKENSTSLYDVLVHTDLLLFRYRFPEIHIVNTSYSIDLGIYDDYRFSKTNNTYEYCAKDIYSDTYSTCVEYEVNTTNDNLFIQGASYQNDKIDDVRYRVTDTVYPDTETITPYYDYADNLDTVTYEWYKDGGLIYTDVLYNPTIRNQSYYRQLEGGLWYVNITGCEGVLCTEVQTNIINITLTNVAPVVLESEVLPTPTAYNNEDLTGQCRVYEPDVDNLTFIADWYKNGTFYKQENSTSYVDNYNIKNDYVLYFDGQSTNTNYETEVLNDLSTSNNDGTLTGYVFNHGAVTGAVNTTGVFGNAYNFDGLTDYIDIGDIDDTLIKSWGGWVTISTNVDHQMVLNSMSGGGTRGVRLRVDSGDKVECVIGNNTHSINSESPNSINEDQWYHLFCTLNGTHLSTYIDGVLVKNISHSGVPFEQASNAYIGALNSGDDRLNGTIDEVRISHKAFTLEEIQSEMNSANPVEDRNLFASYSFEENNATHTFDTNIVLQGKDGDNISQAFNFDGNNQYIEAAVPHSSSVSVFGWIRANEAGHVGGSGIFSKDESGDRDWFLTQTSGVTNTLHLRIYNQSGSSTNLYPTGLNLLNWNYVGFTFDGATGNASVYVNGVNVGSFDNDYILKNSGNGFNIGQYYQQTTNYLFNGSISEVAVWDKTLTETEIGELYITRADYYGTLSVLFNVTSAETNKNENITLQCSAYDGTVYSNNLTSSITQILGVVPVINTSYILPTFPGTNDDLRGYCQVTDYENDSVTYYYEWYINGIVNETGSLGTFTPGVDTNVANLTSNMTAAGNNITFNCQGQDVDGYSAWLLSSPVFINNSAPIVTTSRIMPTAPAATDNLTGYCNATDTDLDNLTYYYIWYVGGVEHSNGSTAVYNESIEISVGEINSSETSAGDQWILSCMASDGLINSTALNSSSANVENTVPVIQTTRISPTTPSNNQTLEGYCNATDADNHTMSYNYIWYVNGILNISDTSGTFPQGVESLVNSVAPVNTSKGQNWTLSCQGSDGTNTTAWLNSTQVTIEGLLPVMETTEIEPSSPYTNQDLLGYCNATDYDGGTITYYYEWYVDSVLNETGTYGPVTEGVRVNVDNVSNVDTVRDQVWILSCLGENTEGNSSWLNSTSVTINNTVPNLLTSRISPVSPLTTNNLLGYCNSTDLDLDLITYYYEWFQDNVSFSSGSAAGHTSGVEGLVNNLSSVNTANGEDWVFACRASDGTENTTWLNSTSVEIGNTDPITQQSTIQPDPAYGNNSLRGYCDVSDADSGSITFDYIWYVDGVTNETGTVGPYSEGVLHNLDNVSDVNINKGQNWTFSCRGNDGSANSSYLNSTIVTIGNINPVIQTSRIEPINPYTNNSLLGYCNATDYDAENLIYAYVWYVDGAIFDSGNTGSVAEGIEINVNNVSSINTTRDEVWILSCAGYDGTAYTSWLNSSSVTINDTEPVIQSARVTPVSPSTTDDLLGYCNSTDLDGDVITYYYEWYKDDVSFSSGSIGTFAGALEINVNNISSVSTTEGEEWKISCLASDGTKNSTWLNSSFVTVGNTVPNTETSTILPDPAYGNNTLRAYCNVTDNDGENVKYEYKWYKDGAIYKEINTSASEYVLQETADSISSVSTGNASVGELWVFFNYTKLSDDMLWQVKHGSYFQNITPPVVCKQQPVLQLALYSKTTAPNTFESEGYCYDGATWQMITVNQLGTGVFTSGIDNVNKAYDGDYGTGIMGYLNGEVRACNSGSCPSGLLYEEGVHWQYSSVAEGIERNLDNVSYVYVNKGEDWTFSCRGYDGTVYGTFLNSSTVTIGNINPVIQTSRINPTVANITSTLEGYCNVTDYDIDNIDYEWKWYVDGAENQTGTSNGQTEGIELNLDNVSPVNVLPGQQWIFSCRGNDSVTYTPWLNSSTVSIQNTPPITLSGRISPVSPLTTNDLIGYCNASDIDLDSLTYYYKWYRDDVEFISGSSSGYTQSVESNVNNLSSASTLEGEEWILSCLANDGAVNGSWVNSTLITVGNTIPITQTSRVEPVTAYGNDTLRGYCNVTDGDGSDIEYDYRWYVNGALNTTGTLGNYTEGVEINLNNVSYTEVVNDQSWIFSCRGTDSTAYSNWLNSTPLVIQNINPVIQTTRISPIGPEASDDLLGYCNATDYDAENVIYNYIWYQNGGVFSSGNSSSSLENIENNVNNVSSVNTIKSDVWILSCRAYDGDGYSVWLNSSSVTIGAITINDVYVTPAYANEDDDLDCNFNVTEINNQPLDVTVTWYNGSTHVTAYENTFVGVAQNVTITTGIGTGSVPNAVTNDYENWTCRVNASNGYYELLNSTVMPLYPLENLNINSPVDNTHSSEQINVSFDVTNLDGGINCTLDVNSTQITQNNVVSGVTTYINYTPATDGVYTWYVGCVALGHPEGINSTLRTYVYDTTGPTYTGYSDNQTVTTPQIGDTIGLNVTVSDLYTIDTCKLGINDDGTWNNETTYVVNTNSTYLLQMGYVIPLISNEVAYWKVWCNDTAGNVANSAVQNYTVKDVTIPQIILGPSNGFSSNNKTIRTSYVENISLDIQFVDNNLENVSVDIVCDTDGSIYSWAQTGIATTTYNHSAVVDLTGTLPQKCVVTLFATDQDGSVNTRTDYYDFYVGGLYDVSTLNRVDNGTYINNFTVTALTLNSYPGNNGSTLISGTSGYFTNLTNGTYTLTVTHPQYFTQVYNVVVENQTHTLVYDTFQSVVYVSPVNTKTGDPLTEQTTVITNTVNNMTYQQVADNNTYTLVFYLNASDYIVAVAVPTYDNHSENFTVAYQENLTISPSLSFLAGFLFYDERTLLPFNVSAADRIEFLMECPDDTNYPVLITNNTQDIPIPCNFTAFRVLVEYGTESYYRNFLFTPDDIFNITIYLIDLTTTDAIYTAFFLDDLLNEYDNPALHIKKIIGGGSAVITADYSSAEDKIGTYLVKNHEYILEISSDNKPLQVMGTYVADTGGEKTLRLYAIDADATPSNFISDVTHTIGMINDSVTGDDVVYATYNDIGNRTTSVTFRVWQDAYQDEDGNYVGTLLENVTVFNPTNTTFVFNATAYENYSVFGELSINHEDAQYESAKSFHVVVGIALNIFDYLSQDTVKWFFTILLSVIAIMGTIKTANPLSLLLLGVAAFFVFVGWYPLSWAIIFFAAMISFLSMLRKGDKKLDE